MQSRSATIETSERPPVDEYGRPTSYLTYLLLEKLQASPWRSFSPKKLSQYFAARLSDVKRLCEQLNDLDLIKQIGSSEQLYQYNLNCKHREMQDGLERFLVNVEIEGLQVHAMMPYSPSHEAQK